jgi:hypothetical protein
MNGLLGPDWPFPASDWLWPLDTRIDQPSDHFLMFGLQLGLDDY